MGTRADFYVGRSDSAEWLGSIAWDGYPEGIPAQLLNVTGEAAYRHAVADFLKDRKDRSLPADGWPWPWETSDTTDFAYAFDGSKVYASCFGCNWFDPTAPIKEDEDRVLSDRATTFPDMTKMKHRPIFGAHSGVIVVSSL